MKIRLGTNDNLATARGIGGPDAGPAHDNAAGGEIGTLDVLLRSILDEYITFQEQVIIRRTRYDLRKAQERAHLLEGLLIECPGWL